MLDRMKNSLDDFFQQADLLLLGLCCTASVYGIFLIYSATRYRGGNRSVVMQSVALGLGILAYILAAQIDLEALLKRWVWIAAFNVTLIVLLLTPLGIGGEEMGNTVSASVPLMLTEKHGEIEARGGFEKVLICGFGIGLSWGAVTANLSDTKIFDTWII